MVFNIITVVFCLLCIALISFIIYGLLFERSNTPVSDIVNNLQFHKHIEELTQWNNMENRNPYYISNDFVISWSVDPFSFNMYANNAKETKDKLNKVVLDLINKLNHVFTSPSWVGAMNGDIYRIAEIKRYIRRSNLLDNINAISSRPHSITDLGYLITDLGLEFYKGGKVIVRLSPIMEIELKIVNRETEKEK